MRMLSCFVLLYKGYFAFASNFFLVIAFIVIWTILVVDPSSTLARLDTRPCLRNSFRGRRTPH